MQNISGYRFSSSEADHTHSYLNPPLIKILSELLWSEKEKRLFDLGCGNGATANFLSKQGYEVCGVDPSSEGIREANSSFPDLRLFIGSGYDNLASLYGRFPVVISLEVIEHVYSPRDFVRTIAELLLPGGHAIISTPYHSYFKNLALAVSGRMDSHFTALWDHGHIKFWSRKTLVQLFGEFGFELVRFERVGRFQPLAKSMICVFRHAHR